METGIKSSFIPQSPMTSVRAPAQRSGGFDLFILCALVVLVASITLAAGVFLYAQYLQTSATSKLEQLERAKQAFEPSLIQDLTRLDDRMRAADTILAQHIAPTHLFKLLEQLTLQTVAFTTFDFASAAGVVTLSMKGIAQSVNSIALQADLLSRSGIISNPIFSNINRQINGVHFDFTAKINPEPLGYAALINVGSLQQAPEVPPMETSPFGTPGEQGIAPNLQEMVVPNLGAPPQ